MCSGSKFLKVVIVTLAVAIFTPVWALGGEETEIHNRGPFISTAEGDVQIKIFGSPDWKSAEEGLVLGPGDMVRTGNGSRVEIKHYSGKLRLHENTLLTVPSILSRGGKRDLGRVTLENGSGLFRLDSERLKGGFKVRTRHIIAGVKGTTFAVKTSDKSSRVAVYDGRVEIREVGRSERDSVGIEKGRSIEAVSEIGMGKVEKFKQQDDWKGWEEGRSPSLEVKTNAGKKKGKFKRDSTNQVSNQDRTESADPKSSSNPNDKDDVSSTTDIDSDRNTDSINNGTVKADDNTKTTVDSISISK